MGDVHDALAVAIPHRESLICRDRRFTWAETAERTRRLANHLHAAGLGCHTERAALAPWESGQDHLGIYCLNGVEYLESMMGAFKARVAPFNVNYRYGPDELRPLLADAATSGLVYHSRSRPSSPRSATSYAGSASCSRCPTSPARRCCPARPGTRTRWPPRRRRRRP